MTNPDAKMSQRSHTFLYYAHGRGALKIGRQPLYLPIAVTDRLWSPAAVDFNRSRQVGFASPLLGFLKRPKGGSREPAMRARLVAAPGFVAQIDGGRCPRQVCQSTLRLTRQWRRRNLTLHPMVYRLWRRRESPSAVSMEIGRAFAFILAIALADCSDSARLKA
jgi:hypothetical protein